MDPIKEAFSKIKEDINLLHEEINFLKKDLISLNLVIQKLSKAPENSQLSLSNEPISPNKPTNQQTEIKDNIPLEGLYGLNNGFSIGNGGVPTDKQTNQLTNQQTNRQEVSDFKRAEEVLASLDNLKKDIRLRFKRLTPQEMRVFSMLYSLEDQNVTEITYNLISIKLGLSESSIRDYINKLINKGIPIQKIKKDNKLILLKISSELKNIASLHSIIELRNI